MSWFKNRMVGAGIISAAKLTVVPVIPDFTAAAESGNAISIVIQMVDPDGENVERAVDCICELHDANGLMGVVGDWRLSETGAGTAVSTAAKPTIICTTSTAGAMTIAVTDVSGSYSGDVYLVVTPLNTTGSPGIVTVTFA